MAPAAGPGTNAGGVAGDGGGVAFAGSQGGGLGDVMGGVFWCFLVVFDGFWWFLGVCLCLFFFGCFVVGFRGFKDFLKTCVMVPIYLVFKPFFPGGFGALYSLYDSICMHLCGFVVFCLGVSTRFFFLLVLVFDVSIVVCFFVGISSMGFNFLGGCFCQLFFFFFFFSKACFLGFLRPPSFCSFVKRTMRCLLLVR